MLYSIARTFWHISRWFWLTLIVTFFISLAANLLVVQTTDINNTVLVSILKWFALLGFTQILLLIIFALFFILTLSAWIITIVGQLIKGGKVLRQYLRSVINDTTGLSPTSIYQQSQALISVNVPLDDNFIHLHALPDRSRYDIPGEQQRLLKELRERPDLSIEEREEQIQHLRSIWRYAPEEQTLVGTQQKQEGSVEEIFQRCTASMPVAIILGAPGSGKSTSLRWLALQMARASLSTGYRLPDGFSARQTPILLRISDYAKFLEANDGPPFVEFFTNHFARIHADLPALLMDELARGRCLLLFDGLDEVANDELRRRVAKAIQAFIASYIAEDPKAKQCNRFIVTSRIVGYEEGPFSPYIHYTLLELTDEQIEQFLTTWCPAVERHMARSAGRSVELTPQQKLQADNKGAKERDNLLATLKGSPGIRRLAVNPLMLTILALIQRSGKTLPHRRIELYQVVTRTLLDNWNQGTGRETLDVKLAEQALSNLAYQLHSSDRLITEREVKEIVRRSMADFYERPLDRSDDVAVEKFIETIRRTSGLFVESGQGLFSFMHRTFQEYFAAQYLLRMSQSELQEFAVTHSRSATWREPLLLAIADKSGQDKVATSNLIQAIANTADSYDAFLHRNLLFAMSSMVDCEAWSITTAVQQDIANQVFYLYGDSFGAGRYTQLQKDIEATILQWLRGQSVGARTPLLEAWQTTLCNHTNAVHQEGATHLLASIAPDLSGCPSSVLSTLILPLLKLADMQELPCSPEVRLQLSHLSAEPASERVAEYAFVVLRLLDANGPAGWLHEAWLTWSKEQPELLDRLTQHSLELHYLLTPVAFPARSDDPNLGTQINIGDTWMDLGQRSAYDLQYQLLRASYTARYPHAYLLKQLLDSELASPLTSWRTAWDRYLQKEMARGRSATYQASLHLRLLLCRGNEQQRQVVADELVAALPVPHLQQTQALITITHQYLPYMLDPRNPRDLRVLRDVQGLLYLPILLDQRDLLDLLQLRELLNLRKLRYLLDLLDLQDLLRMLEELDPLELLDIRELRELRELLKVKEIIYTLCNILIQPVTTSTSVVLLALYSAFTYYGNVLPHITQQVQNSLQIFTSQLQPLSIEHRELITVILRRMGISATMQGISRVLPGHITPEERATWLDALKQRSQLGKREVEELVAACTDSRQLSKDKWNELTKVERVYEEGTVEQIAWVLLSQSFILEKDAQEAVVQALDDDEAIICSAAALLLQHSKGVSQDVRQKAGQKIMGILSDEELSRRPLDIPDYRVWRLDDVLFETLMVLAEQAK